MSMEEDTELRDLVAQTLEVNGCLPKIRAELRASIFLALDEDEELQRQEPLRNKKVKSSLESQEGRTMFCLVREFLEFFDLDFTISVYEPESYLGTAYQYGGRSKIIEDLGISQLKENSALPLLLQLIQIAQLNKNASQTKNIDINLSALQNEDRNTEGTSDISTCKKGLDKSNAQSVQEKDISTTSVSEELDLSNSKENSINGVLNPVTEIHVAAKEYNMNATFNLSNPSINVNDLQKSEMSVGKPPSVEVILSPRSLESSHTSSEGKGDTYDGTSSIAEDSVKDSSLIDLDKSTQSSEKSLSETEFSPPILKDSKSHSKFDVSFDKLKLSPQKTEKLKAKSSLSSLADLPPLQLNKARNDTLLLPSLYSKEFKEKTNNQNLKEIEKFFDVDVDSLDNYEEDFMSESEINLNKSLDGARNTFIDEMQSSSITDSNKNITHISGKSTESKNSNRIRSDIQKLSEKSANRSSVRISNQNSEKLSNQNLEKGKTELSPKNTKNNSGASSVTSDDLNLNIDDILNSPTSN